MAHRRPGGRKRDKEAMPTRSDRQVATMCRERPSGADEETRIFSSSRVTALRARRRSFSSTRLRSQRGPPERRARESAQPFRARAGCRESCGAGNVHASHRRTSETAIGVRSETSAPVMVRGRKKLRTRRRPGARSLLSCCQATTRARTVSEASNLRMSVLRLSASERRKNGRANRPRPLAGVPENILLAQLRKQEQKQSDISTQGGNVQYIWAIRALPCALRKSR
jgi:hypothetical protein